MRASRPIPMAVGCGFRATARWKAMSMSKTAPRLLPTRMSDLKAMTTLAGIVTLSSLPTTTAIMVETSMWATTTLRPLAPVTSRRTTALFMSLTMKTFRVSTSSWTRPLCPWATWWPNTIPMPTTRTAPTSRCIGTTQSTLSRTSRRATSANMTGRTMPPIHGRLLPTIPTRATIA